MFKTMLKGVLFAAIAANGAFVSTNAFGQPAHVHDQEKDTVVDPENMPPAPSENGIDTQQPAQMKKNIQTPNDSNKTETPEEY